MVVGTENVINAMILVNLYIRYHKLTLTGISIYKDNGNVGGDGALISKEWLNTHGHKWNCIKDCEGFLVSTLKLGERWLFSLGSFL